MKRFVWVLLTLFACWSGCRRWGASQPQAKINPTDPQPTCPMCPGTYIPLSELEAYTKKALAEKLLDQQVRDIDIGKAHIGIGMVHRGKLDKPAPDSVAEHDQISEVYQCCRARRRWCWAPTSSTGSGGPRPCAPWSSSTAPATTAPRFATASPMRSRPATSS